MPKNLEEEANKSQRINNSNNNQNYNDNNYNNKFPKTNIKNNETNINNNNQKNNFNEEMNQNRNMNFNNGFFFQMDMENNDFMNPGDIMNFVNNALNKANIAMNNMNQKYQDNMHVHFNYHSNKNINNDEDDDEDYSNNYYNNNINYHYHYYNIKDTNKPAARENFDEYFTTEDKNYFIKAKKCMLSNSIKKSQIFL